MKYNLLISQVYYTLAIHRYLLENTNKIRELYIDSGGFSWQQRGFVESESKYMDKYLKKIHLINELVDLGVRVKYIQLDKPLHNLETRDLWEKQKHLPNFYPVYTISDSLEYLCQNYKFVFVGGINNMSWWKVERFFCDSLHSCKGLSMIDIFEKHQTYYHILGKSKAVDRPLLYSYDHCPSNTIAMIGVLHSKLADLKKQFNLLEVNVAKVAANILCSKFNFTNSKHFCALGGLSAIQGLFNDLTIAEKELFDLYQSWVRNGGNFKTNKQIQEDQKKEKHFLDLFNKQ